MSENSRSIKETVIDTYLEGELLSDEAKGFRKWAKNVWWGTSNKWDREVVKRLCRGDVEGRAATAWDNENKRWGTYDLANVAPLIASGLWIPYGIDRSLANDIAKKSIRIIAEKKTAADKKAAANQEVVSEGKKKRAASSKKEVDNNRLSENKTTSTAPVPDGWEVVISPEDAAEAAALGIPLPIFRASTSWKWLGPTTTTPMGRIRRWLRFSHNRTRGESTVVKEDILNYYESRNPNAVPTTERQQTKKQKTDDAIFDELRVKEKARAEAHRRAVDIQKWEAEHGEIAVEIRDSAKKQYRLPLIMKQPLIYQCNACHTKPLVQFMECACGDNGARSWSVCRVCDVVCHTEKAPCNC